MQSKLQKLTLASSSAVAAFPLVAGVAQAATTAIDVAPTGFFGDIGMLINRGMQFILVIAALLVFLYLVWGGIEWITSGGDKGKTESARNKITAAVIGLIVVAASFAILQLALTFLGVGDINSLMTNLGNK